MANNQTTRRCFIGAASLAAIGLAVGDASANSLVGDGEAPRLPLSILVRGELANSYVQQIQKLSPQIRIGKDIAFADADAIFGNIAEREVAGAKKLRWIQCQSAGVEHYPLPAMDKANITLTNAQGCYAPAIAEHVFALLFGLTRGVVQQARQRKFGYELTPPEMRGMTMGIIGLGGIGRDVARRAKVMDMKVIAVDAEPLFVEKFAMADDVRLVDDGLMDMLGRSDVVVCAAPHTVKSRGMLGADQFAAMKPGAYFINVSRGKIVKTDALLEALQSGHLAGVGLDVTDPEPLPADHPLWRENNAIITSHIAGKSKLSYLRVQTVFVENVGRFVRGQPLLNLVDKQKGY